MLLLLGLMLIACLFLRVVALVGTITMVKILSKFSVEYLFDNVGRNCWFHSNVFCFKVSKDFFCCDLTINGELVFFYLNISVKKLLIFIEQSQKKMCWVLVGILLYFTMSLCEIVNKKKDIINMQNYI